MQHEVGVRAGVGGGGRGDDEIYVGTVRAEGMNGWEGLQAGEGSEG